MEKICGIYQIRNMINNHIYIGSSKNIYGRVKEHNDSLYNGNHHNLYLQRAFNKYGCDNFTYEILILCDIDMLLLYEQRFIDGWKPAYNISHIAGKVEWTKELRDVVANTSRGNKNRLGKKCPLSDETRRRMSLAQMGNTKTRGQKRSAEFGKIVADRNRSRVGWIHTEQSKLKMSESRKGKPSGRKGKRASADTRKRQSDAGKKWWDSVSKDERRIKALKGHATRRKMKRDNCLTTMELIE